MAILDRDRHPARFNIVTSVISGLSLAAIMAVARAWAPFGGIPSWSLVAVTGVAITLAVLARWRPWRRRPTCFFLVSAFSQKHWLVGLTENLNRALERRGIAMVLMIPEREYFAECQTHLLRQILARRSDYIGGFVVPAQVDRGRADLISFCESLRLPVVLLDVEPFDDERSYPDNAVFVGYDPAAIGETAADWVLNHLVATADPDPTVLVIGDREQQGRQQRFIEVMRHRAPDVRVIPESDGQADRVRTKGIARRHLEQLRYDNQRLSVIFCTNDEMALGAVDALLANGSSDTEKVAVIGVNGSPEAVALIDTGHSHFRATVIQDSDSLARIATELLVKMRSGERAAKRHMLRPDLNTGR